MRQFQKVQHAKNKTFHLPERSTTGSAGYDFHSPISFTMQPGECLNLPTGIKAYMEPDDVLYIYVRSSLGDRGLSIRGAAGIIDSDYVDNAKNEGEIMLMLRNDSPDLFISVNEDDRIAQGIFHKYLKTDDDKVTKKRNGGVGSTGR